MPHISEHPFYRKQRRLVLKNCGFIDPLNIREYIATGGYFALAKALEMEPKAVIEEVKWAGLRGRGGAGFPTGRKWDLCRKAKGTKKYVIRNGDEGDPGAYMDRSVLEGTPHAVIEGMLIGAYAVGADEGYIYVRAEYPLAVQHLAWRSKRPGNLASWESTSSEAGSLSNCASLRGQGRLCVGRKQPSSLPWKEEEVNPGPVLLSPWNPGCLGSPR